MNPEDMKEIRESVREAVTPLGREIGELKQVTQRIDDTLRQKQISDAETYGTVKTELADVKKDINGLGHKFAHHISEHWKWLLATTGLVGTIMAAAKFLG